MFSLSADYQTGFARTFNVDILFCFCCIAHPVSVSIVFQSPHSTKSDTSTTWSSSQVLRWKLVWYTKRTNTACTGTVERKIWLAESVAFFWELVNKYFCQATSCTSRHWGLRLSFWTQSNLLTHFSTSVAPIIPIVPYLHSSENWWEVTECVLLVSSSRTHLTYFNTRAWSLWTTESHGGNTENLLILRWAMRQSRSTMMFKGK